MLPKAIVPEDFRPKIKLICGEALAELSRLPDDSVDCCVTSPPYFQQMDIHAEE
jgi:DNA modification methylase